LAYTTLDKNQNLFGSWASVDCFCCLNIACNDDNDIRVRGLHSIGLEGII